MQINTNELASPIVSGIVSVLLAYFVAAKTKQDKEVQREKEFATLRFMVWQLWRRIFRTGVVEGLEGEILQSNSPITTSLEAFAEHKEFVDKLSNWYAAHGQNLNDLDLLIAVDANFEKELLAFEVQHKITSGASLAAACFLIRPNMSLFSPEHVAHWKKMREKVSHGG